MTALKLLCFLLIVPALACLGHDAYIYYLNTQKGLDIPFQLSDLGYLWVTYAPESFAAVKESFSPESWRWIDMILEQSGVVLFGGLSVLIYAVLGLCWLLGVWPFARIPTTARANLGLPGESKGPVKYSRK